MSLDLSALSRTKTVADGSGYEWRVCVLSISARTRAGDGLPFVGEFQRIARNMEPEARNEVLAAQVEQDPAKAAEMAEYLERAAMQAVTGVREAGAKQWQDVRLVPPDREDLARGRLSVSALDAHTLRAVSAAALTDAREAADKAGNFPAEE